MNSSVFIMIAVALVFWIVDTIFAKKIKVIEAKKQEASEEEISLKKKFLVVRGICVPAIWVLIFALVFTVF